jgi:hypothetical protein
MALPWILLGHRHHTVLIRVEHAAHFILPLFDMAAPYSETSSSDPSASSLPLIFPSVGAPSVFPPRACAGLTLW